MVVVPLSKVGARPDLFPRVCACFGQDLESNHGDGSPGLGPRLGCLPQLQDSCDAQVRSDAAGQDGSRRGDSRSLDLPTLLPRRYTNLRGMTEHINRCNILITWLEK